MDVSAPAAGGAAARQTRRIRRPNKAAQHPNLGQTRSVACLRRCRSRCSLGAPGAPGAGHGRVTNEPIPPRALSHADLSLYLTWRKRPHRVSRASCGRPTHQLTHRGPGHKSVRATANTQQGTAAPLLSNTKCPVRHLLTPRVHTAVQYSNLHRGPRYSCMWYNQSEEKKPTRLLGICGTAPACRLPMARRVARRLAPFHLQVSLEDQVRSPARPKHCNNGLSARRDCSWRR